MTTHQLACVVLAAGQGTRMKSKLPKVLHPVAGRPMLLHVIATAAELKPDRVIVVVSPGNPQIAEAAKPHGTVVQEKQLGTADALRAARAGLSNFKGDVLVLYGDTPLITTEALQRMVEALHKENAAVVVAAFETIAPAAYGRIVLDKTGRVARIVEAKDASEKERQITLCNGGLMLLSGDKAMPLLEKIGNQNAKGEYYLTDIVQLCVDAGHHCSCVVLPEEDLFGVNDRADLAHVEALMQRRLRAQAMTTGVTLCDPDSTTFSHDTKLGQDVFVEPNVVFGTGVTIASNVTIKAFCHIEDADILEGAVIGPFARIRPGSTIGQEAHIGNFVEIKKSRVGKGSKINHHTYVGDAEIGSQVNIGAGTITVNYDGYRKHKTTIGDGAFIGSNSSLVAPVTVGSGAFVGAGSVITNDVPADTLAVARGRQTNLENWARRYREKQVNSKKD